MSKPGLVLPFAAILALAAFAAAHAADPAPCLSGPAQEAAFRAFADQLLVHKDARGAYGQYAASDLVQRNRRSAPAWPRPSPSGRR